MYSNIALARSTRVRHFFRFRSSICMLDQKDRLDPLGDSAEFPEPWFLVFWVGSDQFRFESSGDEVLEVFPSEAFVADDDLAGADEMAFVAGSIVSAASRSPIFGFASPQMMGIPSGVQIR